jgi:hypothetical protein
MVVREENVEQDIVSEFNDKKITQQTIEEEWHSSMITVA